jgi:hypothetical protein
MKHGLTTATQLAAVISYRGKNTIWKISLSLRSYWSKVFIEQLSDPALTVSLIKAASDLDKARNGVRNTDGCCRRGSVVVRRAASVTLTATGSYRLLHGRTHDAGEPAKHGGVAFARRGL